MEVVFIEVKELNSFSEFLTVLVHANLKRSLHNWIQFPIVYCGKLHLNFSIGFIKIGYKIKTLHQLKKNHCDSQHIR